MPAAAAASPSIPSLYVQRHLPSFSRPASQPASQSVSQSAPSSLSLILSPKKEVEGRKLARPPASTPLPARFVTFPSSRCCGDLIPSDLTSLRNTIYKISDRKLEERPRRRTLWNLSY